MREVRRRLFALGSLLGFATAATAQGPPAIRWMRGGHSSVINKLVYSSDGTFFVSGSSDLTIKIWRISDGLLLRTIMVPGVVSTIALSPDNSIVCGGGLDPSSMPVIGCWHVADGSQVWSVGVSGQTAFTYVDKLAFSPDGTRLASADGFNLLVFDASDGSLVADFSTGYPFHTLTGGLAYSPDGQFLGVNTGDAPRGENPRLALLNAANGSLAWDSALNYSVTYDVAFSPDSQLVTSVNGTGLHVFGTSDHLTKPFSTGSPSTSVAFSPNGARIATGYAGAGSINLFNTSTGAIVRYWSAHGATGYTPSLAFSPDSTKLLSGYFDIKRWKASDGSCDDPFPQLPDGICRSLITGQTGAVYVFALSDNDTVTAVAPYSPNTDEHVLSLVRTSDGALLRYIEVGPEPIRGLALSPDGHHIAASDSQQLRVWNVDSGNLERTTSYPAGGGPYGTSIYRPLAYTPDGTSVAVGGDLESIISLWNPATGTISTLVAGPASVLRFLPPPDGRLVIANQVSPVAYDSVVRIATLAGHVDRQLFGLQVIGDLAVSPDGKTIAAGGIDGAFSPSYVTRLWRVSDGATLQTLVGHTWNVRGVAFAWDSNTVITGSKDGTVRIWRASDGAQLRLYDAETYSAVLTSGTGGVLPVAASTRSARFLYGRGDGTLVDAVNPDAEPKVLTFTVPTETTGGCKAASAKVVLDRPAPPAGLTVSLASTSAIASVPGSLTFKSGASSKTFKITTTAVPALDSATISATLDATTSSRAMAVRPIGIASLTLSPGTVTGGASVTGTVSLECAATPGDLVVNLSSSIPSAAQPAVGSLTIPQGSADGTFSVTTTAVSATKKPTIKAVTVPDALSKSKKLVINP